MYKYLTLSLVLVALSCCNMEEMRLSKDNFKNYDLDCRHKFSPDDKWLVFDIRQINGGIDMKICISN